jgi:hypothetical protein
VAATQKKRSLRALKGFMFILLIYAILVITAASFYPKSFSPLTNTLPQLGDGTLNPEGAIFYNVGVYIVSGSTFFIAIALLVAPKQWLEARGAPTRKVLFYFIVSFMLLFTLFSLLTTLITSGTDYAANSLFTLLFLMCLELFAASSALGIRRLHEHLPWVPAFGFAVAVLNLVLVGASVATGLAIFSWGLAILTWSYMVAFIYEFSNA